MDPMSIPGEIENVSLITASRVNGEGNRQNLLSIPLDEIYELLGWQGADMYPSIGQHQAWSPGYP
jgi:hypothetical protein